MLDLNTRDVFSKGDLARICTMREENFGSAFGLERFDVPAQRYPDDFYFYQDNGADVLAVAHLDTVGYSNERGAHYVETEAGTVVFSRALDDRLGAYTILDVLPKLGITVDVLLTVGEESGQSTAAYFTPPKQYDWMIEFDRGGTDVVLYQYDDKDMRDRVRACGAYVGQGIFSDISYLDHLGCKGANWGVGYQDYHGPRAHAYLEDYFSMIDHWQVFYAMNEGIYLPHLDGGGMGHRKVGRQTLGQAFIDLQNSRDEYGQWDDLYPEARYTPQDDSDLDWHPSWHGGSNGGSNYALGSGGYHGFNDPDPDPSDPADEHPMALAEAQMDPFYWHVDKGA